MYHTLEAPGARRPPHLPHRQRPSTPRRRKASAMSPPTLARGVPASRIIPFLSAKHSLDYCMMFARRAVSNGCEALAVVGGRHERPAPTLRRARVPASRHHPVRVPFAHARGGGRIRTPTRPSRSTTFARGDFEADFFLTQIVSHHSLSVVEAVSRGAGPPERPRSRRLRRLLLPQRESGDPAPSQPVPSHSRRADHAGVRRRDERRGDLRAQHPGAEGRGGPQHLPGESGISQRRPALPRDHAGVGANGELRRKGEAPGVPCLRRGGAAGPFRRPPPDLPAPKPPAGPVRCAPAREGGALPMRISGVSHRTATVCGTPRRLRLPLDSRAHAP